MNSRLNPFSEKVMRVIRSIPRGRVATYGQIARLAGNPRAARQVSRLLSSCSEKYGLPWHRVINSLGKISLPDPWWDVQKALLEKEGIPFSPSLTVDLSRFQFKPGTRSRAFTPRV